MKRLDRRPLGGLTEITRVMDPVRDDVTIWYVPLDQPSDRLDEFAVLLSPDEDARAKRFRFEHDRRRFTVCRAVLRRLLARELTMDAREVNIVYGPHGKPSLGSDGGRALCFNVSHSDGHALVALAPSEVGVDIERIRPVDDLGRLAETAFSLAERAELLALPEPQQLRGFFNCWTRKEAYIKASGEGLSRPLDEFDVSLVPGEPAHLLRVKDEPGEPARWSLSSCEPVAGCVAAVCVERA